MKTHFRHGVKPLAAGLCLLIALPLEVFAKQDGPIPTQLNIVVVEGEGAVGTGQRVNPEPLIRVEDENHKPLVGATVVFTLPTEGATGEFANGEKTFIVPTGDSGQAAAKGLRVNQYPGKIPIHVSVSYKGLSARTIITLESVLPPGAKAPSPSSSSSGGHGKLIAILAIVGGAAAGGAAYFLTHKSGTSSSSSSSSISTGTTPIGITPGNGTIVGGH
jgi:hypothetical protein